MWRLWSIRHIPRSCHRPTFFLFPRLKNVVKAQWFTSVEEVTAKATRALTEVSKHGVQEYLQKGVRMLVAVQGKLLWRKCCVNICKLTYFCLINQFLELFEASLVGNLRWLLQFRDRQCKWLGIPIVSRSGFGVSSIVPLGSGVRVAYSCQKYSYISSQIAGWHRLLLTAVVSGERHSRLLVRPWILMGRYLQANITMESGTGCLSRVPSGFPR
jgi:hypothetical protein